MSIEPGQFQTGIALSSTTAFQAPVTQKEKPLLWFSAPLKRMKGDDAFVFLMVCFPLLESIIRHETGIPDDQDVPFSDNSPALNWFAEFMTIPKEEARPTWDAFRNGLLHRAMIKGAICYELNGKRTGRPASFSNGVLTIHVWELRDKLVGKLETHHRKLWQQPTAPLPQIFVSA